MISFEGAASAGVALRDTLEPGEEEPFAGVRFLFVAGREVEGAGLTLVSKTQASSLLSVFR